MSLWGFDGEDNSFTAWSSLSQFDDMVWNDFGEANGDHVVPNPSSPQSSWMPNGDRRKRLLSESSLSGSTNKGESTTSTGVADSTTELSSDVENRSKEALLERNSTNLVVELDLTARSELFGSYHPPTRQEKDATGAEVVGDHQTMRALKGDAELYTCKEDTCTVADPFTTPNVNSQGGGLEMFGSENVTSKADTLLELGWENISNLDDMDKLFRNDSPFEPVLVNGAEGLDWPSSSSPLVCVLDRGLEFVKPPHVSESIAAKVEVEQSEDKTKVVFNDCLPRLVMDNLVDVVADNGSPRSLRVSAGASLQQPSFPRQGKSAISCEAKSAKSPAEETGLSRASFVEVEKVSTAQAYRLHRHSANWKRCDDKFKRTTPYKKLSPGLPCNAHLANGRHLQTRPLRLPGQTPLLQPATTIPLQYFPPTATPGLISAPRQLQLSQGVPYVQVAYPIHHVPAISSCSSIPMTQMKQPQSIFVDIHQSVSQGQRQPLLLSQASPLISTWPFDVPNCPPTSNVNMTPQEKMEKLRWRQQMQARIAVEQQQQQLLAYQNGDGINPIHQKQQVFVCHNVAPNQPRRSLKFTSDLVNTRLHPLEANQWLVSKEGQVPSTNDRGEVEYSLEGSILCQLKSTVSALDIGTRLCIRDALYRLARSAMKRRAAGIDNVNASQGFKEQDSNENAVESSTASGPPSSGNFKPASTSVVETETNPIDRSIAKLLFSKPLAPMFGQACGST